MIRFENLTEMLSTTQLREIFCTLYHHSRVHGIVVYCVWHSDYNDSIILHHNKRSIISTDIIKCQNCLEQVRYFVHIMQRYKRTLTQTAAYLHVGRNINYMLCHD